MPIAAGVHHRLLAPARASERNESLCPYQRRRRETLLGLEHGVPKGTAKCRPEAIHWRAGQTKGNYSSVSIRRFGVIGYVAVRTTGTPED